jgi:hypothetical protein
LLTGRPLRFEKKAHGENEEQSKQMENNMISMASDIEKLRSELANTQQRAQERPQAKNYSQYFSSSGHQND